MKPAALFLLISLAPLLAQDRTALASIDEAFEIAGVRTTLESLFANIKEMPAINDAAFYQHLRTNFLKHYDAAHMSGYLALQKTSIYRTMRRLEEAADTPAMKSARQRFETNLKSDPPPPKRLDLLRRLDEATNATEFQLRIKLAVSGTPKADTKSAIANEVLNRNLFAYRNTDDAELEDYLVAARQPDVIWFNRTLQAAIRDAVTDRKAVTADPLKPKPSARPVLN